MGKMGPWGDKNEVKMGSREGGSGGEGIDRFLLFLNCLSPY